jgi:glycosyltransferase involved in cell wall biosynthesis
MLARLKGFAAMARSDGDGVPTVSVGLPVFNGEQYVAEAIESILGQSFEDFELLIQDNASTDDTEEICRAFAQKDPRVQYVRNQSNVGAIPNFNLVFKRARGRYFKWAAHDDICAPDFLRLCVEVLEKEPEVVLCCGQARLINDDGSPVAYDPAARCYVTKYGQPVGVIDPLNRAEGPRAAKRFWDVLVRTMRTFEIFGVIRSDVLRRTGLHAPYYGSDKVLLAELSLHGPFRLLPEVLLYRRCHGEQSSILTTKKKSVWIGKGGREGWLSLRLRKVIPGYVNVVRQSRIGFNQKLMCYSAIAYRFVAPQTWIKQFMPGRYTET